MIYFILLETVLLININIQIDLEDDLKTGEEFNLLGFGEYDKASELPALLRIFNVKRYYFIDS